MNKVSKHILPTMRENPPILVVTKLKKLEAEGADSDKVESIDLSFLLTLPTLLPDFPRSSLFLRMEAQRSTSGG
jgi:hypothetical protein